MGPNHSVLLNTLKVEMAFEVVFPPTNLAEDCQSLRPTKANDWYCPRKWDHFLCWPRIQGNKSVAIPCNASTVFMELVKTASKSTQERLIPGMHDSHIILILQWCHYEMQQSPFYVLNSLTSQCRFTT